MRVGVETLEGNYIYCIQYFIQYTQVLSDSDWTQYVDIYTRRE